MKTKLIILTGFVTLCSWNYQIVTQIKKAEWLTGTWQNKTAEGTIYESWKKSSDKLLTAKSYMLQGKDTVVFETIDIEQNREGLFYIPRVKNQNANLPVRFVLISATDRQLVFENKTHDFPQIISYTRIKADSLIAEISGVENGKTRKEIFSMSKVSH